MSAGYDVPGVIRRLPGGVAMNVAMTLIRFGLRPAVLTAIGTDPEGEQLMAACAECGVDARFALRDPELPTDRYMAIEDAAGLIAAVADARSLERAGARLLDPLTDGRLAGTASPWDGPVVLDGNLDPAVLEEIAGGAVLSRADLRVAPASPGKASRLRPLLGMANATLYLNLTEAGLMLNREFTSSAEASHAMLAGGAARVLITDGASVATDACGEEMHRVTPPEVFPKRITGAGDTFMAAHIAAELAGHGRAYALEAAIQSAATYVSEAPG